MNHPRVFADGFLLWQNESGGRVTEKSRVHFSSAGGVFVGEAELTLAGV